MKAMDSLGVAIIKLMELKDPVLVRERSAILKGHLYEILDQVQDDEILIRISKYLKILENLEEKTC